jgi:hypothetical protein
MEGSHLLGVLRLALHHLLLGWLDRRAGSQSKQPASPGAFSFWRENSQRLLLAITMVAVKTHVGR